MSPTRAALLYLIAEEPRCVGDLCSHLGVCQTIISRHLAQMRACGIVETARDGKRNIYAPTPTGLAAAEMLAQLDSLVTA
jgi:DNA-binding transcriptional ArsR family regulator